MASWAQVASIFAARPEVTLEGERQWKVNGHLVAWERPLRRSDLDALGKAAPAGDVLGVYAPLEVKDALVASGGPFFTTPHFDGWPAVLVALKQIRAPALRQVLTAACVERAAMPPKKPRARKRR